MVPRKVAYDVAKAQIGSQIFPHHRVGTGVNGAALTIDEQKSDPGKLLVSTGRGPAIKVGMRLEVPEVFRKRARFMGISDGISAPKYERDRIYTFDELEAFGFFRPVILNQTETELILGLKLGSGTGFRLGGRDNLFLPFLWALPKSDFIAAVAQQKANSSPPDPAK